MSDHLAVLEHRCLGTALTNPEAMIRVGPYIREELFRDDASLPVVRIVERAFRRGEFPDEEIVRAYLTDSEVGAGPVDTVVKHAASNVDLAVADLKTIVEMRSVDRVLDMMEETIKAGRAIPKDTDWIKERIVEHSAAMYDMSMHRAKSINAAMDALIIRDHAIRTGQITAPYFTVENIWPHMDQFTQKMFDLIVVGASSGVGKTSFLVSLMHELGVNQKRPTMIVTLEETAYDIAHRLRQMISVDNNVDLPQVRAMDGEERYLDELDALARVYKELDVPIWIVDTTRMTPGEVRGLIREEKLRHPDLVVTADYFTRFSPDSRGRGWGEVKTFEDMAMQFADIAQELGVPILLASQLNEEEGIGKHRFKWTRGLFEFARQAWILQRADEETEEKYGMNLTELHVIKHKDGPTTKEGEPVLFEWIAPIMNLRLIPAEKRLDGFGLHSSECSVPVPQQ